MTILQENISLKKTPLYGRHVTLGGKMVNFSGWALPVYYSGIIAEHRWVRQSCGVFDVSHLGEIRVKGPGASPFLQHRLTNDMARLQNGRILYSLLCDERGFTLDDILIYQARPDDFYLVVNAANAEADWEELAKYAPDSVTLVNDSDRMACIAVQGPKSEEALETLFGFELKSLAYYSFKEESFTGGAVWISRSGYTGEDGFEIFSDHSLSLAVWDKLADAGQKKGILPAGLGARNTLRLEAGNALYGNDLDRRTTPLEAGLEWAVALGKGRFVGRDALVRQKEAGLARRLVGFKVLDRAVAREHYPIFKENKRVGTVTSGSYGPTVDCNIGLGYVEKGHDQPGHLIEIEIHGHRVTAEIVRLPFVEPRHKRKA